MPLSAGYCDVIESSSIEYVLRNQYILKIQ